MSRFTQPWFKTYEDWNKGLKEGVVVPQIAKDFIEGNMTNVPVPDLEYFKKNDQERLAIAAGMFYDWNAFAIYDGPDGYFEEWYERMTHEENFFIEMGKEFAEKFDYSGVIVPDLPKVYWQTKHFVDTDRVWARNATYIEGMDPVKKCALSLCLDGCRTQSKYNKDPNIPVDMAKMIMYQLPVSSSYFDAGSEVWPNMFEKGYSKSFGPGWSMEYLVNMCVNEHGVPDKMDESIFKTIFEEGEQLYGKEWADIVRNGYREREGAYGTYLI